MDVIGAGFGRTGTLSLKVALEMLGFGPCLHMIPVLGDAERAALFHRAAEGDQASLGRALAGHRSTVDWPGAYFWRELVSEHPRAKVILTVRDPARWYESAHDTIYQAAQHVTENDGQVVPAARGMLSALIWEGTFDGRFADREHAVGVFERHNEAVRSEVPADRLIEFRVADGWQPLCDFLGVPVPDGPFPHVNDAASFQARVAGPPPAQ